MSNNLQSAATEEVGTFGWDTAFVASFDIVNQAITAQKSYPATFDNTDAAGVHITGDWTTWQLSVGGGGGDVQLACTVTSGSITLGAETGDLTGATVIIQVNLEQVVSAESVNDPTAKPGTGSAKKLIVKATPSGHDPAVSVLSSSVYPNLNSPLLEDLVNASMSEYFNANILEFGHTFAVMDINEEADKDGFQWLKPTAFSYAVAKPTQGATLANSAFGLIAMVDNNPIGPNQEQAVDSRALALLPSGANSAFVISEHMVAKHMLMRGAISTIQGSSASDFEMSTDGLSVTNKKKVTWGHFQTDHGVISPTIDEGNFILRADDTYIYVEISKATYSPSAGITVEMNLTQKFTFKTVKRKDGKYIFIPDTIGLGHPDVKTSVSLSKGLQITELITGIVAAVAGVLVVASGIGAAIAAAADVAVDAGADGAEIAIDAAEIEEIADANPEALEEANAAGAEDADEGVADPGNAGQVQNGGMFTSTRFRLATGMIGAFAGLTSGGIAVAKAIVNLDYDEIPEFDEFASNCMGASKWPAMTDYELKGVSFRESLVIATELKTS